LGPISHKEDNMRRSLGIAVVGLVAAAWAASVSAQATVSPAPGGGPQVRVGNVPGVGAPVTVGTAPGGGPQVTVGNAPAAGAPMAAGTAPGVGAPMTAGTVPAAGAPMTMGTVPGTGGRMAVGQPAYTPMPGVTRYYSSGYQGMTTAPAPGQTMMTTTTRPYYPQTYARPTYAVRQRGWGWRPFRRWRMRRANGWYTY
jgi:hypothetical protein